MKLVKISENDNMTNYVDTESVEKNGNVFHFIEVIDFKEPKSIHPDNLSCSHKLRVLINCETQEQSILEITDYSGQMGTGKIIHEGYPKDNIRVIPPESLSYKTMEYLMNIKTV